MCQHLDRQCMKLARGAEITQEMQESLRCFLKKKNCDASKSFI